MPGWVKLHRRILESDMYRSLNSKQRDVLITLLLMANHKSNKWEYKGEIYTADPGQMVTSLDSIQRNCAKDTTTQNIRTALKKLETWGFLTNKSTKTGRLITIVNWRVYQSEATETNKAANRELTKDQQRANKELTPNKNVKNDKEDKEDIYTTHPSEKSDSIFEEIENYYIQKRGLGLVASPTDFQSIQSVIDAGIPLSDILAGIDHAFSNYKPKHSRDRINSFKYCERVVFDRYERKIARSEAQKDQGGKMNAKYSTSNFGGTVSTQPTPGKWDHFVIS